MNMTVESVSSIFVVSEKTVKKETKNNKEKVFPSSEVKKETGYKHKVNIYV